MSTILSKNTVLTFYVTKYCLSKKALQSSSTFMNFKLLAEINTGHNQITPFFINNPFLTLAPKTVSGFLKNRSKKFFRNCLGDGLLTSV